MAGQPQLVEKTGERGRNRTFNLLIKSQLLCQLSYAPGKDWPEQGLAKRNRRIFKSQLCFNHYIAAMRKSSTTHSHSSRST